MKRIDERKNNELRPFTFQWYIAPHAQGSVLASCGKTQVICSAMISNEVPKWMKFQNVSGGWITAEYSMLPYSTLDRKERDVMKGRLDGRSSEIQRLIGRSLRACIDLELLGARTLQIDCDVLCADGGTRTTAITGAFLAVKQAVQKLLDAGTLKKSPIKTAIAATSIGLLQDHALLDLCYVEDKDAQVDLNLVMTSEGEIVELQASGEESTFTEKQLKQMLTVGKKGIKDLFKLQESAWKKRNKK
jgi:ribonuclease PH